MKQTGDGGRVGECDGGEDGRPLPQSYFNHLCSIECLAFGKMIATNLDCRSSGWGLGGLYVTLQIHFQTGNAMEREDTFIRIGAVRGSIVNAGDLSHQTPLNHILGIGGARPFSERMQLNWHKMGAPHTIPRQECWFCNPNDLSRGFQYMLMDA
jgi:hypothetical protein